jgi:hypothetical protein
MNAKLAQRSQRVVVDIGVVAVVAWFIIVFSVWPWLIYLRPVVESEAIVELEYYRNMTKLFLCDLSAIIG